MTSRAHVLLWTDSTAAYLDAIKAAGLADRVVVDTLPRKEKPSADQMARTEALMAHAVPPGLLPAMPKLRWAQAMTAGVEGWLALPDLPANLTLTCARGTHRESMPENIIGALFYVAKPYAAAVENQKHSKWVHSVAQPLTGKTLGILGLGAIGQEVARIAAALGMRVIGTRRRPEPMANVAEVLPAERTPEVLAQSDFLLLLLPATPETDNFINAERLGKMKPSAWLLNFGRGHLIKDDDLIAAVKARRSPAPCSMCSGRSRCPPTTRSGPPRGSSCCPISAARTRSATGSSRACSSTIWAASWTASRSRKWWTAKRDTDATDCSPGK